MPDPEVNELHHRPVGDRFQRQGPDAIRHARAMAKEVREPGRLNHPNEWSFQNPASDRDGQVSPGNNRGRLEFLEMGNLVDYALNNFTVREGWPNFSPRSTFAM